MDNDETPDDGRSNRRCRGCDSRLTIIGTTLACNWGGCARYAWPVNDFGQSEEEAGNPDEQADGSLRLVEDVE